MQVSVFIIIRVRKERNASQVQSGQPTQVLFGRMKDLFCFRSFFFLKDLFCFKRFLAIRMKLYENSYLIFRLCRDNIFWPNVFINYYWTTILVQN